MSGLSKLLMSKPAFENQGVLDLGKNCYLCNQLDFLPFKCEFCDHIYCSEHRNADSHNCKRPQRQRLPEKYEGPTAASFFPDPETRKKDLEEKFQKVALKSASAIAKTETVKSTPLSKIKKFLQIQKLKKEGATSKSSIFGKLKTPKAPNPIVQLAALKKVAKGTANVAPGDRIYVWALYINRNEEELEKISPEAEKIPIWLLRNWSVGRSLDLIADQLKIINNNNSTLQSSQRLNLFRVVNEEPVPLDLSKKNLGSFTNCDTLYLVKG